MIAIDLSVLRLRVGWPTMPRFRVLIRCFRYRSPLRTYGPVSSSDIYRIIAVIFAKFDWPVATSLLAHIGSTFERLGRYSDRKAHGSASDGGDPS